MASQRESVVRYYNETRWDYTHLWRSHRTLAMHFGYYADGVRTHRQAAQQMNARLAAHVGITAADRVLDAGCGLGGSSLWLAANIGCSVTGVNITPFQIETARHMARQRGLDARFLLADYARSPFVDGAFTVFWGLESIVHAESKADLLGEAYRLLAPGGRVLVSEYVLRSAPPLNPQERQIVATWLDGWAMPSLLTDREYTGLLGQAGFVGVEIADWTPHVAPSLARIGRIARGVRPFVAPLQRAGLLTRVQRANADASHAQIQALRRGLWRYQIITATRPAGLSAPRPMFSHPSRQHLFCSSEHRIAGTSRRRLDRGGSYEP
ncbi:MAG: methyltransferase domain-containing protein [Actinomycetota bacterium]|nr:methyltransferase domain-containing protein [Actinomycetota bacterium]